MKLRFDIHFRHLSLLISVVFVVCMSFVTLEKNLSSLCVKAAIKNSDLIKFPD